jgi:PucR C-terminal helix-turn-helix domain/GGDEF-like domain
MAGMPIAERRLADWRERLRKSPLARKVIAGLEARAQEIWSATFDLLRRESPEYRNAVDDEFTAESKNHCGELLKAIVGIAAGRPCGADPFAFVRRHAEWRARRQVPLVASLHAYRLAHKTYWSITREQVARHRRQKEALQALATLSDFWIELFEAVGAVLEEAHGVEEARIVAQHTRAHAAVVDSLLNGIEPGDGEARQLLALCGMRPLKIMTVALVRPLPMDNGSHVDSVVAPRSLARLMHQVLPSSVFGKLVGTRNGETIVIASSEADTAAHLVKYLGRHGFGRRGVESVGARIGISLDKRDVADLPEAFEEARMALDFANGSRALRHFGDIDLAEFVIHGADRAALRLIPDWVREAHATGRDEYLIRTIRAFAECSLNVKETARRLGVHTNTVYFRLNRIQERTGADPRTFHGTSTLLTALRLLDNHG